MANVLEQIQRAKKSQSQLANLKLSERNKILRDLSTALKTHQPEIFTANSRDLKNLQRTEMRDRLVLNENRAKSMIVGLNDLIKLPDPLGRVLETKSLESGLNLKRVSVPLGVLGVIYESRPNVTVDLAGLAIKSGNAVILKGGSEAFESNKVLVKLIHQIFKKHRMPSEVVYLIDPNDEWKDVLLNAHGLIDVLIPRGSNRLIEWVRQNSHLPVIETGAGVCHTFVDSDVIASKAAEIIVNAKTQRPDVCNALDTLVIHQKALNKVMPLTAAKLAEYKVEIHADAESHAVLKKIYPSELLKPATANDYGKEFLSLTMAIKTVKTFEQGLEFIKQKTSGHSEAVLSKDKKHIHRFLGEVDAAAVYANVSTRFTDGGEFGLGAEVGISTQKLHARGPMGLQALTSYKWIGTGEWLVRKQ